jgi:hypothetical protein
MKTMTNGNGKERRTWKLDENNGSWLARQMSSWKGSDWSEECRSDATWRASKEEAMADAERMAAECEANGWK